MRFATRQLAVLAAAVILTTGCVYKDDCVEGASRMDGVCRFGGTGVDAGTDGGGGPADGGEPDACTVCGSVCVDLQWDAYHCGDCDTVCGWGSCDEGACAEPSELAVLYNATCVLLTSGEVWCWGNNLAGQLGDGTRVSSEVPVQVVADSFESIQHIWGSVGHVCAIDAENGVWCWGNNTNGQVGFESIDPAAVLSPRPTTVVREGVRDLDAGTSATCWVDGFFRVWCWGLNEKGDLGSTVVGVGATAMTLTAVPVQEEGTDPVIYLDEANRVDLGDHHACAILKDVGELWCWGDNDSGQLGAPTAALGSVSEAYYVATGVRRAEPARGHTCGLWMDGTVWCWGKDDDHQIGVAAATNPQLTPLEVDLPADATDIATGSAHSCALLGGEIHCWGSNQFGQLGDGNGGPGAMSSVSDVVAQLEPPAIDIDSGNSEHMCAIVDPGADLLNDVYCWGKNWDGQIGNGESGADLIVAIPTRVIPPLERELAPP